MKNVFENCYPKELADFVSAMRGSAELSDRLVQESFSSKNPDNFTALRSYYR